ncbi:hypothetical protein ACOMHN_007691 [Nucella lapillus]
MLGLGGCGSSKQEALVYVAVFLYYTGENVVVNTALPLISYTVCRFQYPNTSIADCQSIERHFELAGDKTSSFYYMLEKVISFIPPLLLAAFFGPWSDQHGRMLPFLLPFCENMAAVVLFLLVQFEHSVSEISLVMTGFLIRAFSGHFILFRLISFSYIADLIHFRDVYINMGNDTEGTRPRSYTNERRRGVPVEVAGGGGGGRNQSEFLTSKCRLQVADSMGSVAGAGLAWALQMIHGQVLALATGAVFLLLGALVVVFFLRNRNHQNSVEESENVCVTCLKKIAGVFHSSTVDVGRVQMWGSVVIVFLMVGCLEGWDTITIPFVLDQPLSWPGRRFSAFVASFSLFQSVFPLVIAPALQDHTVVGVSLLCSMFGGLWMAFSRTTWSMMLAGCFNHMVDCIFPAVKAMLNKDLRLDQVGKVLSRLSLAEASSIIVGPLLIVQLYKDTASSYPGLAFLASSAVPAAILTVGVLVESFCPVQSKPRREQFQLPELDRGDVSRHEPDMPLCQAMAVCGVRLNGDTADRGSFPSSFLGRV